MAESRLHAWTLTLRVFDAPGNVFQYVAERPVLLPPYAVNTALAVAAAVISLPGTVSLMESQFMERGLQANSWITDWVLLGGILGAVLGQVLTGLFVAAVLFGMLQIGGHHASFRGIFSVVGYARIPLGVGLLLNGYLISSATSNGQAKLVSLSAAVFASAATSPLVRGFLSTAAPFDIWYYALVVMGLSAVTQRPAAKVCWAAALLYGLTLLVALLGSGLSPISLR